MVCLFISLFIFHKVSTFFYLSESCQGRRYITLVLTLAENRSITGPVQPTAAETDIFGPVAVEMSVYVSYRLSGLTLSERAEAWCPIDTLSVNFDFDRVVQQCRLS